MSSQPRTQPWLTLPVHVGNAIQIAGLASAGGLLRLARRPGQSRRALLLVGSWLLAYFSCHALAHWAVGRLAGIRFVAYGVHGTTNPAWYPPGLRWLMLHLPLLSARTDPQSRRAAGRAARAAMYGAGTLSTVVTSLGIPLYGRAAAIPGARALLLFASIWIPGMLVGELAPHSDLRRAWRDLRSIYRT